MKVRFQNVLAARDLGAVVQDDPCGPVLEQCRPLLADSRFLSQLEESAIVRLGSLFVKRLGFVLSPVGPHFAGLANSISLSQLSKGQPQGMVA